MSIFSFLPLISAIFVLVLGIFVYFKNRRSRINVIFFLLTVAMTVWLFGTFMMFISKTDTQAIFWDRMVYLGVVLIPALMYHFSLIFSRNTHRRKSLYFGYLLSLIFLFLSRTDYFVSGLFRYEWGYHTRAQFFHHVFLIFFSVYLFLFYFNIYRYYKRTTIGLERNQAKYIFVAFLLFLPAALGYFPAYGIDIYPFGYLSGVIFTVILAYAIIRCRLMDIRVVIKRSTVFSAIVVVITAAYVLAAFLLSWFVFGGVYTLKSQIVTGLIVALLVAIGFRPFYDWLRRATDTFLFKGEYRPQELIADLSDVLSRTLSLEKIVHILERKIEGALRVERIKVVILEGKRKKYLSPFKRIIAYFQKQKEPLVLEELKKKRAEKVKFEGAPPPLRAMEKIKAGLIIPLITKDRLVGLFVLGPKKSGDIFTSEDIQTLETIAAQAAIALENARLYQEQRNFSQRLQREVKRQTRKLREAYEELKKLDQAKSDFISMASHQLRTPVSVMKGIASMIIEGDLEKLPEEKRKKLLNGLWQKSCKLEDIINDILNATKMASATYRLQEEKAELINLGDLLQKIVNDFQSAAQERGIKLLFKKPSSSFPKIYGQKDYLTEAISNLIDNAIKYTPSLKQRKEMEGIKEEEGYVKVSLTKKKNNVIISVEDNGIGIPKKEIPKLFEKFSRASNARDMYTDGSGLGLYIAKEIIEGHYGRIKVKSKVNEGTTFSVILPTDVFKEVDVRKHIIEGEGDKNDQE